jgi:hypothetical protein
VAKAHVRLLEPGDIAHVAANLRRADQEELDAVFGPLTDPLDAIGRSVMLSSHYWTLAAAEPLAVFGVAPLSLLGGVGAPWLLGTEKIFTAPSALVREGRRYVQRMLAVYPHLLNYVDARNTRSVRWLARLGFEIQPAKPFGAAGLPFHRFELKA